MKSTLLLILFSFLNHVKSPTNMMCGEWARYTQKGECHVYMRQCPDLPIKEFKVLDRFYADFDKIIKVMENPNTTQRISETCTEARIIKPLNANEIVQYFYFDMPMTITDRDILTKNTSYQTPTSYKSISEIYTDPSVPERKGAIRMKNARSSFYFEKQNDGSIKMEYTARADPEGLVPAWFVNLLAGKEAIKMTEKLKKLFNE